MSLLLITNTSKLWIVSYFLHSNITRAINFNRSMASEIQLCALANIKLIDPSLFVCSADFGRLAAVDKEAKCRSPTTLRGRTTLSSASCCCSRLASASTTASSASSRSRPLNTCLEDATLGPSPSPCPLLPGKWKSPSTKVNFTMI